MHTGRRRREWCTQVYFTLSECLGTLSTPRRPAHKCLRVYLMSATDNKGIPQLDAHQTTSLHPLHHLAMWHHIILFRSAWPSGGGAHEQRQRERQQDPRRCVDEGQEYAPHLPCARLEALQELSHTRLRLVWSSRQKSDVFTLHGPVGFFLAHNFLRTRPRRSTTNFALKLRL